MDCNKTSDTASHKSFIWRVKWIQIGFHWSIKLWIGKWWRAIKQARAGDLLHQGRRMFCGLPQSTVQSLFLFPRAGALTARSPHPSPALLQGTHTPVITAPAPCHDILALSSWLWQWADDLQIISQHHLFSLCFAPHVMGVGTAAEGHYARTRDFQLSHGCLSGLG